MGSNGDRGGVEYTAAGVLGAAVMVGSNSAKVPVAMANIR